MGMDYPLDNALYQWEEGYSRAPRGLPRTPARARPCCAPSRRSATSCAAASAPPSPPPSSPTSTREGTDWCLEAARWALPEEAADLDPQAIVDGAFYLHLRGATDYSRRPPASPQD